MSATDGPKSDLEPSPPRFSIGFENVVEQRVPVSLRVQGHIPSWLRGSLYRTGPGTFRVLPEDPTKPVISLAHWFDGLGMNHRFQIKQDGSVLYQSHSSSTSLNSRIAREGVVPEITFGQQDPCQTIFRKFFTIFSPSNGEKDPDDVNIAVTLTPGSDMSFAGIRHFTSLSTHYLVAKSDVSSLQIIDAETLKPLEVTSYGKIHPRLDGQMSAAHSCVDKTTGEFFNFVLKFGRHPTYKVFRIRPVSSDATPQHTTDILAEINDAPGAYLHSFVMTKKYVVLCVWQADFTYNGLSIFLNRNLMSSIEKWNPGRDAFFYVISKETGGVTAKFTTPSYFAFHTINAFDSGTDDIIIDISIYDDHSVLDLLYLEKLRTLGNDESPTKMGQARRYVLRNVRQGGSEARRALVQYTFPSSYPIELPTLHPDLYHRPYRYTYGISKQDRRTFADKLIKLDMLNQGTVPKTWGNPGFTVGEPIFVPRPGSNPSEAEDDGVLLTVVLDADSQKSALVILDAKEMKEIARAEMDTHFPFGFHGVWLD